MKGRSLFGLMVSLAVWGTGSLAVFPQSSIQGLPNGNYRVCERRPPSGNGPSDIVLCFNFSKTGSRIVGFLGYTNTSDTSICVEGIVSNNIVRGQAVRQEKISSYVAELISKYQGSILRDWPVAFPKEPIRLRLGGARAMGNNLVLFRTAVLNLNGLNRFDSESILYRGCPQ